MLLRASTCERLHCFSPVYVPARRLDRSRSSPASVYKLLRPSRQDALTSTVIASAPITFRRLLPPGDPAAAQEIVTDLGLHERPSDTPTAAERRRPYVVLNMVSTLDGRATLGGRSGPLSDPADRALFHGLRAVVDAVMAGAGTVRAERYGPIVRDPDTRRLRSQRGLREQPLACVVSSGLAFPPDLPLLCDPDSEVAILTSSRASLPETAARVEYVRAPRPDGSLDLDAALAELHDRLHVGTLLCEGGPHLNTALLSAGLVDELFLSVSPLLAGGGLVDARASADGGLASTGSTGGEPPLRILAGVDFDPPLALELRSALEHDSRLFLRYRVRAGG
jgi:riboflavin-specific deaminase-like protein